MIVKLYLKLFVQVTKYLIKNKIYISIASKIKLANFDTITKHKFIVILLIY